MSMYINGEHRRNNAPADALLWQRNALRKQQLICAWCQQLCNDSGQWHHRAADQHELATIEYSHGICPTCKKKFFGTISDRLG